MRIARFLISILVLMAGFCPLLAEAKPNCGNCPEYYCEDPTLAARLKAQKKRAAERDGLPPRLSALFDQLDNCEACIKTAPDWPHITWNIDREAYAKKFGRDPGYDRISRPWDADTEMRLRDDLKSGLVKSFHIYLGMTTCKCCKPGISAQEYEDWREQEETGAENKDGYNDDKGFDDGSPQQNFDDKSDVKDTPKDLTELPAGQQRPQSLRDPGVQLPEAVRLVHVVCRECEPLEKQYNDIAERINNLRRPIGQARRELSLAAQVVDNVWTDIHRHGKLAQTPEVQKKQDELMDELSVRQNQYLDAKTKLEELLKQDKALRDELESVLEAIKKCEEEGCKKKAAAEEPKTAVKAGGGEVKAEDGNASGSSASSSSGATPGGGTGVASSGGAGNGKDAASTDGSRRTTNCPPCVPALQAYVQAVMRLQSIDWGIQHANEARTSELRELEYMWKNSSYKGGLGSASNYLGLAAEIEKKYNDVIKEFEKQRPAAEAAVAAAKARLEECEKQCAATEGGSSSGASSGVAGGGGTGKPIGAFDIPWVHLPFDWKGPYRAKCRACVKLADELNRIRGLADRAQRDISGSDYFLNILEPLVKSHNSTAANAFLNLGKSSYDRVVEKTPEQLQEYVDELKAEKATAERNLERITAHFHTVLAMFEDCEKTRCAGNSSGTAVRVGGDAGVKIEQAIGINGTNPHNARDVEQAGVNGQGSSASSSGVVTPPSSSGAVSSSSSSASSSSGTVGSSASSSGTTPPQDPPLNVSTSGSFSFAHTVGGSPCPQNAGSVSISSNNGNPLTVTNVQVTGTIASRINTSVSGSGSATPSISAQFNCSSAQNGNFSGNVTATVTDTVTGETQQISVPISGSVSG